MISDWLITLGSLISLLKVAMLNGSWINKLMHQYKFGFDAMAYAVWISTK